LSWSWVSKIVEKKIMNEISKQLNLEISKDGKIQFKPFKQCQFCKAMISEKELFCPRCRRSLT